MYADKVTPSMEQAITETKRRRELQMAHNKKHGITPKPVTKAINKLIETYDPIEGKGDHRGKGEGLSAQEPEGVYNSIPKLKRLIKETKKKMEKASAQMDYLTAQKLKSELTLHKEQLEKLEGR